jgi:hypothetical protein
MCDFRSIVSEINLIGIHMESGKSDNLFISCDENHVLIFEQYFYLFRTIFWLMIDIDLLFY